VNVVSFWQDLHRCEQLLSFMKNVKSRTRTRLTEEHLEGCMRIATTEIKHDTVGVLNQKQCQILY
jgi:hypothetical protein